MKPSSQIKLVNTDKVLVTFLMSSTLTDFGSSGQSLSPVEFDIWERDKFIGALSKKTYIQIITDPGEHLFIARGGNWSFLKANLDSGKKYYIFVNLYPSFWGRHGVAFQPVRIGDKELVAAIPQYMDDLKPISVINEKYNQYSQDRVEEIRNEIKLFETTEYEFLSIEPKDGI
jgi:hypothetical protein